MTYAMTISSRPQFRTWITWFLVAALALLLVPASHAGKKDKKKKEEAPAPAKKEGIDRSKIDTSKLVWPLPPDLPRIKFVSEHFGEHMRLAPLDFAMSYITRSGRVDLERLRKASPRFVARYEREHG